MIKPPKGLGVFAWRRLLLTIAFLLFIQDFPRNFDAKVSGSLKGAGFQG